jgi:Glyoxalase/Bleomycin resistance protein/Dioxygenase superfamily
MKRRIEQLKLGAEPARWAQAGFEISGEAMRVGEVLLVFGPGEGVLGWRLAGFETEVGGLPVASPSDVVVAEPAHPNGAIRVDHLVVFTSDLERTTAAMEEIGVERRRVREVEADGSPLRQGFFRLGEVILEVVEHVNVEPGPARFWGITFAVADLDAAAELLGEGIGTIRDAVQPGRRIATVRGEAGLGLPVALISDG